MVRFGDSALLFGAARSTLGGAGLDKARPRMAIRGHVQLVLKF